MTACGAGAGRGLGDLREQDRSAEQEDDATNREDAESTAADETITAAGVTDGPGAGATGEVMRGGSEVEDCPGRGVNFPDAHQSSK